MFCRDIALKDSDIQFGRALDNLKSSLEANGNCQLGLLAERVSQLAGNVKTSLSVNIGHNEQRKNDTTMSCAAVKNNGDNIDVAVDWNTSISRDFDEVNKIPKEKVRNA